MISSQQALNETIRILKEHLSDVSGETGDSHAYGFYQLAQNIFVKFRVADHGLYMQTFVSHDNGVAPELVSIISVVYRESPKEPIGTKWKTNGYPNSIIAFQYVYPCWDMDFDDIPPIAFELITFAKTSTFVPPHLCTKDVKVQEITSDIGIRDVTNKLRARYCSIKESKTKKNMKEEIDMGQVPSAQDVRDERSKRQVVDNLPEVRELKRKVNRMRLELDKCEEGSQAEKELISKIKAANQQIRDYYDRPLNLRSLLGMNESKTNKNMKKNVVKINENTLRQIVAESVKKVLKEYGNDGNSPIWNDSPQSGYEEFTEWGERAAYLIMTEINNKRNEYAEDLFDEEGIRRMCVGFELGLKDMIENGVINPLATEYEGKTVYDKNGHPWKVNR